MTVRLPEEKQSELPPYIHIYIYIYTYVYIYIQMSIESVFHVQQVLQDAYCMCVYTYVYKYMYLHIQLHRHRHLYLHIHTYNIIKYVYCRHVYRKEDNTCTWPSLFLPSLATGLWVLNVLHFTGWYFARFLDCCASYVKYIFFASYQFLSNLQNFQSDLNWPKSAKAMRLQDKVEKSIALNIAIISQQTRPTKNKIVTGANTSIIDRMSFLYSTCYVCTCRDL